MNKTEHLLTCLAEECAEVQQAVSKALRFGLQDGYPGTERTNHDDIARELVDLFSVMEMLIDEGLLSMPDDGIEKGQAKQARVREFMLYAQKVGALDS